MFISKSILWNVLWSFENLKADYFPFWFWTDGIRIHPGCPSYLAGILKSAGKQRETRKDYLKIVNLENWNRHLILKFQVTKILGVFANGLHCQISIFNVPLTPLDNNAERIIELGHTEHTALIIPRACQNMEGRFIVEAKSTGSIFSILISLIMILCALELTISYQSDWLTFVVETKLRNWTAGVIGWKMMKTAQVAEK